MDEAIPDLSPDAATAWRRARRSIKRLFEQLADLDEVGGIEAVADEGFWGERQKSRVVGELMLVHRMLLDQAGRIRSDRRDVN